MATGSDPAEYEIKSRNRCTHVLGPDLATQLIKTKCNERVLKSFEIMVGKKFIKGERIKVQSKVKSVISQNAILRSELLRLRSQLEIERETLYQLEKAEKK